METKFYRWLLLNNEPGYAFAARLGLNKDAVTKLAGQGRSNRRSTDLRVNGATILAVSKETGIAEGVLIAEAIEATRDPRPPRQYTRRERDDGKANAAH
jgi:hypothetical protein